MPDIAIFARTETDADPKDFSELTTLCGEYIDRWLAAGGEPTDETIAGFYSLWAQSLDLPKATGQALEVEQAEYFGWAYPFFVRYRDEVRASLWNSTAA